MLTLIFEVGTKELFQIGDPLPGVAHVFFGIIIRMYERVTKAA